MAGCYGGSPEDRYFERQLFTYLDSLEEEPNLDDSLDDQTFLAECVSEAEDNKYARLVKAIKDQDPAEVGQQFLDIVDAYWQRVNK